MPNNYFITGLPQAGKTTMLRALAKKLKAKKLKVGGFVSPELSEHGTREGFYVEDIATGKKAMLAETNAGGPRVGKYRVNVKQFEAIALPVLKNHKQYDIIIIDEIGKMEMESEKFGDALADVLQTNTHMVASLSNEYLQTYEIYGEVYPLDESNRNSLGVELLNKFAGLKHNAKATKKKPMPKKSKARKTNKRAKSAPKQQKKKAPKKKSILHHLTSWFKR